MDLLSNLIEYSVDKLEIGGDNKYQRVSEKVNVNVEETLNILLRSEVFALRRQVDEIYKMIIRKRMKNV